jgi:serine/threonine protein kinase
MGDVYRARDPRLGRDVAIKILPADVATDPERVRRFEQEARALGQLNHPNVLATFDVGQIPDGLPGAGSPFLVSELLEGQTLRDELASRVLPLRTVLAYARDIAEGLAAAHQKGIVHRDLKPANLFVTEHGRIKILDFGLAKLRPNVSPEGLTALNAFNGIETDAGVVLGTTFYMAPEQVRAQAMDHRSDIFAFGCVLYEMLTGRRAFQSGTAADTMAAILNADPPPTRREGSAIDVPPALDRVVRRCLEKNADQRFQSARDLAFSLETMPDQSSTETPPRSSFRVAVMIAAAAGLATAAWLAYQSWSPGSQGASRPTELAKVTPFAVGEAVESQPAWSPAGNFIAFASDEAGNDDIWLVDLSGANPVNLTKDFAGRDSFPAWSPDGTRIAFFSDRDAGGIFTMTPLGSDVRKVAAVPPSTFYAFSLQWSHTGALVYTGFDDAGDKQVYSVSSIDSPPACLTCGRTKIVGARDGEVSPSGRLLAFVGSLNGQRSPLYVMNLESGDVQAITERTDAPHWQAEDHLLFLSARDGLADVWEVRIDPRSGARSTEPARLTSGLDATAFAVSADGTQMLAVKERSTSTLWTFPTSAERIDSTAAGVALTTGSVRDARPRWSASADEVFFESNRRGSLDVWRVAAAGGTPVRITSATNAEQRPRPSPDGKWLVFDTDGNWLWIARIDGGGAREAADWKTRYSTVCCADWSPTSSQLAFTPQALDGYGRLGFADVDAATGQLSNIRDFDVPGALEEYPRWSPDGQSVVYEAFNNSSWNLWSVNADGAAPVQLTDSPGNERQAVWQRQPLMLYFLRDANEIWRMPMRDRRTPAGPPTRWLAIKGLRVGADALDISEDHRRFVVSLQKPESDLWLVVR